MPWWATFSRGFTSFSNHVSSTSCRKMFASRGEITPPWGVPESGYVTSPSSEQLYGPYGPPCPEFVKALIDRFLRPHARGCAAIANPAILDGELYRWEDWLDEASSQHEHLYYMYLCGVPDTVIREHHGLH